MSPDDRLAALHAGCNDFLSKPSQVRELYYKLKQHLNLTWITREPAALDRVTKPDTEAARPPSEAIEMLTGYIQIGDLLGLQKCIDAIGPQYLECKVFFDRIKQLAGEFRIAEIKKLLSMRPTTL